MNNPFEAVDIDAAIDMKTVTAGEYNLIITEVELIPDKFYVALKIVIEGQEEFTKDIRHPVWYPKPEDDSKKSNNKVCAIRDLCSCFSIENSKDPESWVGSRGSAILKETSDIKYGDQNEIERLTLPA